MSSYIKQYWQLIPKGGEHFEELCSFLSDISTDEELLASICLNEENIPAIYLTEAASDLGDAGISLSGEFEENRIRHQERLDNIVNTEISDFCFDPTNVKEQVEAVEMVIEDYKWVFTEMSDTRNWKLWDEYMDQLIQDLYNAGMQEILDEANMQYEKYCGEK